MTGTLDATEGGDLASFVGSASLRITLAAQERGDTAAFDDFVFDGIPLVFTGEERVRVGPHTAEIRALLKISKQETCARIALLALFGDGFPTRITHTLTRLTKEVNVWVTAQGLDPIDRKTVKRAVGRD